MRRSRPQRRHRIGQKYSPRPRHRDNGKTDRTPLKEKSERQIHVGENPAIQRKRYRHRVARNCAGNAHTHDPRTIHRTLSLHRIGVAQRMQLIAERVKSPRNRGQPSRPLIPGDPCNSARAIDAHLDSAAHNSGHRLKQPDAGAAANPVDSEFGTPHPCVVDSRLRAEKSHIIEMLEPAPRDQRWLRTARIGNALAIA